MQLPREIDRIADARVHAEAAGGNDEVRGIAGKEHAAVAVAIREQQILLPLADIQHLVRHRDTDRALELRRHLLRFPDDRVQRPVLRRVLHDQKRRLGVGDVIVASLARAVADRNPIEEIGRVVQPLLQPQQIPFALQVNPELSADRARAAVAADDVLGAHLDRSAVRIPHRCGGAVRVLGQAQ